MTAYLYTSAEKSAPALPPCTTICTHSLRTSVPSGAKMKTRILEQKSVTVLQAAKHTFIPSTHHAKLLNLKNWPTPSDAGNILISSLERRKWPIHHRLCVLRPACSRPDLPSLLPSAETQNLIIYTSMKEQHFGGLWPELSLLLNWRKGRLQCRMPSHAHAGPPTEIAFSCLLVWMSSGNTLLPVCNSNAPTAMLPQQCSLIKAHL